MDRRSLRLRAGTPSASAAPRTDRRAGRGRARLDLGSRLDRAVPSLPPGDPPPAGAPPVPLAEQDRPSGPAGPSVKAAAVVLGLTVVIFVGGSVALGLSASTAPQSAPTTVRTAPGSPLPAAPAAGLLRPIEIDGQPPSDVVDALAVPVASAAVPGSEVNAGVDSYDHTMAFSVATTQAKVVGFFRAELRADGWQQVSSSPTSNGEGIEVLGQHGGSDGNTWEVGVVVHPTTFGAGTSAPDGTTTFSIELYIQNTDD